MYASVSEVLTRLVVPIMRTRNRALIKKTVSGVGKSGNKNHQDNNHLIISPKTDIELSEEKLISERDGLTNKLNIQHNIEAKIDLFKETCHKFLAKINDPKIVTERLKKDIIKFVIDEVVIEGEKLKIAATIPLPSKIHEREIAKTDLPDTFNAGATLGPINQTKMERIWTKHKQSFDMTQDKLNTILKPKVFVGMSGGVDSSVSAALLKKAGYDVTGVFIKTWSPEWLTCSADEERRDAMRVAAKLKIPFITLDLAKEYKKGVVDYMVEEYRAGRVPNPDVMCNKVIKFGGFFDFAMAHGADFVATGHYAQVFSSAEYDTRKTPLRVPGVNPRLSSPRSSRLQRDTCPLGSGRVFQIPYSALLAGADGEKDQTYFLWTLGQKELSRALFPIGGLQKSEVRKLARKFGLPNAEKKDSQGLCFMGKVDVKDFLKHYIKERAGDVQNERGKKIGRHNGVSFFTIGERHGFVINKKSPNDTPYYVIGKDAAKNILIVSNKKAAEKNAVREIRIKDINWNRGAEPDLSKIYSARTRYRQELRDCKVSALGGGAYGVTFKKPPFAAAGQSVVFYDRGVCLGGGVIV